MGKAKIIASMLVMVLLVGSAIAVALTRFGGEAAPAADRMAIAAQEKEPAGPPGDETPAAPTKVYPDDVYGVVYGEYVTKDGIVDHLLAVYGNQFRDLLMDQILVQREADKLGITCTDDDINAKIAEIEGRLQGVKVKDRLAQMGMQYDAFVESQRFEILREKLVKKRLADEVKPEDLDSVHAYHILLRVTGDTPEDKIANEEKVKAQIEATKNEITDLESFKAKAKELSQDVGNAEKGGELGDFGRGVMVKEFEDAVFTGPLNTLIGPIKTTYGYHLIWVDKRTLGKDMTPQQAEEAKKKKIDDLYNKRGAQEQRKLMDDLQAAAQKTGDYAKPHSFTE
jgi:parvulin-like peptidyl-prolyl isomerase